MKRYLTDPIRRDLGEKMVFMGGSRQVGKSTLALSLIRGADESHPAYLSWDVPEHQRLLDRPNDHELIGADGKRM